MNIVEAIFWGLVILGAVLVVIEMSRPRRRQ